MVTGQAWRTLGTSVFLPQSPLQRILVNLQIGARDEGGGAAAGRGDRGGNHSFCLFLNKSLSLKRKKKHLFFFSQQSTNTLQQNYCP